jgi:hypothetical protein
MNDSFLKRSGFAKGEDRKLFRYWGASMEGCVAPTGLTAVHTQTYRTELAFSIINHPQGFLLKVFTVVDKHNVV